MAYVRNRASNQPDREAELVCLTCQERGCDGGFRGCPYSKKFGLNYKPPYLVQHQVGHPEPLEREL